MFRTASFFVLLAAGLVPAASAQVHTQTHMNAFLGPIAGGRYALMPLIPMMRPWGVSPIQALSVRSQLLTSVARMPPAFAFPKAVAMQRVSAVAVDYAAPTALQILRDAGAAGVSAPLGRRGFDSPR